MKKIILAESSGFCFGVKRAVDTAISIQKRYNKKIYTLGPLIHNNDVVKYLEENNIYSMNIDDIALLEQGEVIIIRSHGIAPEVLEKLKDKQ
jgi:4-hydroxy-3-methylbut-2-enyl diphosphate reductase